MFVFVCAGCGADLTTPLSRVVLPVHAHQTYGNGIQLPVLMEPGTFAVDPESWGHRPDGAPGAIVIAPGDTRGTLLIPEKSGGCCCGLVGTDGPNMVCEACGLPVASRIDDCSLWQSVRLVPHAVHRTRVDDIDDVPLSWAELRAETKGTPPFEPITTWGTRPESRWWSWSPQWEAAAGRALAHLLAASQGRPVTVPGGLTGEVFQRALDALLPAGPPPIQAALAGPGLPASDAGTDILLAPVHPQTGETWTPSGPQASGYPVPLPYGVWLWLAFPEPDLSLPASGSMPDGVLRDDPPLLRPPSLFRTDAGTFRHTMARLPAIHSPWLREIFDDVPCHLRARIF
ncbi:hypothetical protein RI138_31640 [Streptomyces sp. C11-1]|uniref:Uncharacterized protein n=1 Tax=Streptomyces durocortorensis TaxID=2811104 RepID=A0ABY9W5I1_9ACTN|nr:hypothetical protein [Streptomyces durocortorensis]WNF31028.1 hypothetical protein RI138_31640 [Streptomyces durocortorensis]